ncbi:MAG: N-acetylmuramoyl-L-alanine amidase [Buchnera aphidicola (Schlechtendalia peitan)]
MDAGHGGKDPGAIGINKTQEKDITFTISKKLKRKLNNSKFFKAIMTRTGNYYVSISKRTKIAQENKVNVLISIHTNSSKNSNMSGLSIWVLSKKKNSSKLTDLSRKNINNIKTFKINQYHIFNKMIHSRLKNIILNVKFNHIRESGYVLAKNIIQELKHIHSLYKVHPIHANFGILKSPYYPSILIETGFISNKLEEKKLSNKYYQNIIVHSIYLGLKRYFFKNCI